MRNNSYLVNESAPNSYFFNDGNLLLKNKQEDQPENLPQKTDKKNSGILTSISNFWKRLVTNPQGFPQSPNERISSILENEKKILADNKIKSVLSVILDLPMDSKKLSEAVENSNRIFHEDYPFDFILEYQDERLGMMLLDVCYNLNNQGEVVYKFKPELKSFRGLF